MFSSIANYLTRSKIAAENLTRQKQFLSWDKIERIALFIDESKSVNKSEVDKFILATKKYVEVFFVELNSNDATYSDWKCFTKKDKTIFALPKSLALASFRSKKFDALINVSVKDQLFTANLISQVKASFKCGNNNLFGELDLIIERKEGQDFISYLNEVKKYLEMIRTN